MGIVATTTDMGASQSDLESFIDPGPAITEERITRALRQHEKTDDISIVKMEDASGNVKGEGFMAALVILKVEALVDGKHKTYSWVVKSMPREAKKAIMTLKFKLDEREVNFFGNLLPGIKEFLSAKGVPDLLPNFCSAPYSSWTEDDKILIMQNLKDEGWRDAVNKKAGLDIEHVRAAIKWLATFHAITYAFLEEYDGGIEQAKQDFDIFFWSFDGMVDWDKEVAPFRAVGNNGQRDMFKSFEDENSEGKYSRFLEEIIAKHLDLRTAAMKVRDHQKYKLRTICHGDAWFNNMMFKYDDEKKLGDIIFIDFQIPGYLSPAIDLAYFLYLSTTKEVRSKYLDHILTLYHTHFENTLEKIGVSVDFSYEDLLEDFMKARLYGLNFALSSLPSILAEKNEDILEMGEWMNTTKIKDEETKSRKMKEMMEKQKSSFDANAAAKIRIADIVDECMEGGNI